jgi:HKD family nuclease
VLSLLRDLQPLILKQEQKMALTLNIENDLRYRQGVVATAKEMLREGIDKQIVAKVTKLTDEEIKILVKEIQDEKAK